MEFRVKSTDIQCGEEGKLHIGGYVNVVERESEMLYSKRSGRWFKETMKKGVFQKAITGAKDIPLLFEHDWNKKLASTEEGSLSLREDNIGLRFDAEITDPDIYEKVKSGLINACSFGFRALKEEIVPVNPKFEKRMVDAIELLEVSVVGNPAYIGSLAEVRSYEEAMKDINEEVIEEKIEEPTPAEEVVEVVDSIKDTVDIVQVEVVGEAVEEVEKTEEATEDSEERFSSVTEISTVEPENDDAVEIVEELIEEVQGDIKIAEEHEQNAINELNSVKEYHESVENIIENDIARRNYELLKLRLKLLKLNELKRGI